LCMCIHCILDRTLCTAAISRQFTTRYKGVQYLWGSAATSSMDSWVQSQDSERFVMDKVVLSSTCQSSFWQSSVFIFIHIIGAIQPRYWQIHLINHNLRAKLLR
jgi:hypothetical protein